MYGLKANFYPAAEPKEGYIGKADISVANAIRLNNISVFEHDGKRSLSFAKFGKEENERSYIIPSSKEAYAAMLDVVSKAVDNEKHFAFTQGKNGVRLEVHGAKVDEPYADARFFVDVGGFCSLNGISTRVVQYEKDGKQESFVSVDLPVVRDQEGEVRMYEDREGKDRASHQFDCLKDSWTDKDGKEQNVDYAARLRGKVLAYRKKLLEPTLDEKIAEGQALANNAERTADAPEKDNPSR